MRRPKDSRVLRYNRRAHWVAVAIAVLPEILGYLLQFLAVPEIAELVRNAVPLEYRTLVSVAIAAVAERNRQLRYQTNEPIDAE